MPRSAGAPISPISPGVNHVRCSSLSKRICRPASIQLYAFRFRPAVPLHFTLYFFFFCPTTVMSDDDSTHIDLHASLLQTHAALDALLSPTSSTPASPSTLERNRALLDDLSRKMLSRGQVKPLSTREHLQAINEHMDQVSTPHSSQPDLADAAAHTIENIRRVAQGGTKVKIVAELFNELSAAIEHVETPTASQPRDPDDMRLTKTKCDELLSGLLQKELIPTPVEKVKKTRTKPKVSLVATTFYMLSFRLQSASVVADDDDADAEPPVGATEPATPPDAPVPSAFALTDIQSILDQMHLIPQMTTSDVLDLYAKPLELTQPEAEMAALLRSFGGICAYPEANWASDHPTMKLHRADRDCQIFAFQHLAIEDLAGIAERISSSSKCGAETNVNARLTRRHTVIYRQPLPLASLTRTMQILQQSATRRVGETIVHSVLDKIDALYFSRDYNLLSHADKTIWMRKRYFEYAGFDLGQPYADNITLIETSHRADFTTWRRDFGDKTTARNRLLDMYTFVSAPFYPRQPPTDLSSLVRTQFWTPVST